MNIIIGSDHAGYELKEKLKKELLKKNITIKDVGTHSTKSVDYPNYARRVAKKVKTNKNNRGILICGTGAGMCMAANRHKGIRAAVIYDVYSAKMSRQHNDANIACLRARQFSHAKAKKLVNIWLKEKFSQEKKYKQRLNKLDRT